MGSNDKLEALAKELLNIQHFDALAVGVIDFKSLSFSTVELCEKEAFFDLASLTKPLTLALAYSKDPKLFNEEERLLLEHRGGLPAWGRLGQKNWREQVQSYSIKESETLYSDFSALRLQIELEKKLKTSLYEYCQEIWDKEICSWLDHEKLLNSFSPITGMRKGELISGFVHDDNAFVIGEKVSHAGLFGSVEGVCQTLLGWQEKFKLLQAMRSYIPTISETQRFALGWDRALDSENTLAGKGCGKLTFGHLGFTGTSIWIDPELERGHVILTNATRNYWYDRAGLKKLRQELGSLIWSISKVS